MSSMNGNTAATTSHLELPNGSYWTSPILMFTKYVQQYLGIKVANEFCCIIPYRMSAKYVKQFMVYTENSNYGLA